MSVATALARSRVRSTNTTSRAAPRRTTANAHADPTAPVPIIPTFITSALPPPAHRRDRNHRYRSCRRRSEEHTSELQSHSDLVCRLLLEKKKTHHQRSQPPQKHS